jgi:iron complex outermembrane receptor protein
MALVPHAVATVERSDISRARPTWGLDEALLAVPGVYTANRYNFSLDQRLAIRGFGSRSAFAVRGVKVLIDGVPQTLPDGQGQLTNLDLGMVDRIEVLRGASSALYGNASGGVISIWTNPETEAPWSEEARVVWGAFDREGRRSWSKWHSSTRVRAAGGSALLHLSRLRYAGERDHSAADLRYASLRFRRSVGPGWWLGLMVDVGDQPRADNPGALTDEEANVDRNQAAPANLAQGAGKDVLQAQAAATLRRTFADGGEVALTLFGLSRDLENPQTFAYISIDRAAHGARVTVSRNLRAHRLTAGLDFQRLRDDRVNFTISGGAPGTTRTLAQLEHVTEVGPFVQSTVQLTPAVAATGGLRYDRVAFRVADRLVSPGDPNDSGRRLMDAMSGSLGLTLAPAERVTLYANIGTSFETPTTTELANRPDTAGGFNADLAPQRARSMEVGMRGTAGSVAWSVAAFRAEIRDLLTSFEVPSVPQRRFFRNAGRARHDGLEVGASATLGAGVRVVASWTASRFRYTDFTIESGGREWTLDGRPLPGLPEHWVRMLVRARPAWGRGAWLEVEQAASSGYFVHDTASTRTRGWTATHVRIGWDGSLGGLEVAPFVGLNNAFNHHYVGSVVVNAAGGRHYEPAPGRNAYLGLQLTTPRKDVAERRGGEP